MRIKIAICLLFIVTLFSCEKDFVVQDQLKAKKLVVNSLFSPFSKIQVFVTQSSSPSNPNGIIAVSTATIDLYENDVFKEKLVYTPSDSLATFGSYKSLHKPTAGKKYSIKIQEASYGELSAEDSLPAATPIIFSKLLADTYAPDMSIISTAEMNFKDEASLENFYELIISYQMKSNYVDSLGNKKIKSYYYQPYLTETNKLAESFNLNGYFFSDKGFDGQQQKITVTYKGAPIAQDYDSIQLYIQLHSVSKTNYEYHRTLHIYQSINTANDDPEAVFSNIKNGYGIFAGDNWQTEIVKIK
jgi:hypothetical protein